MDEEDNKEKSSKDEISTNKVQQQQQRRALSEENSKETKAANSQGTPKTTTTTPTTGAVAGAGACVTTIIASSSSSSSSFTSSKSKIFDAFRPQKAKEKDLNMPQYLLAEAEFAKKHVMCYTTEQTFSKFFETSANAKLADGPSCSNVSKHIASVQIEIQSSPLHETNENFGNAAHAMSAVNALSAAKSSSTDSGNPTTLFTTKSTSKRGSEFESQLPRDTIRPIDTEIAVETANGDPTPVSSVRSLGSLVCRICHNSENPERLVSPCLCKGTLSFVHIHCLERWISTSRSTVCELCQFQYNTQQTLRYTCIQSLRMWYSRSMSRRALQEDCQMFSLLTLVAFGIIGTLLVGIQYYFIQGRHWGLSSMWTKGWLLFFLFTTLLVYFINIYMILRSQLSPWYRWWQSARDIKLILENRKPFKILPGRRMQNAQRQNASNADHRQSSVQTRNNSQQASRSTPSELPSLPLPPLSPTSTAAPLSSTVRTGSKLEISSEIIEIPLEAFDSYAFGAFVTNI